MDINRSLSSLAVTLAAIVGSGQAAAAPLPFCVTNAYNTATTNPNQTACNGAPPQQASTGFSADLLTGAYNEKILVRPATAAPDAPVIFNATIVADWSRFSFEGQLLNGTGIGGNSYSLYAVIYASGFVTGPTSFQATSATLDLFLTTGAVNLQPTAISNTLSGGRLAFTGDSGAPDTLVASSTLLLGGSGTTAQTGGDDGFAVTFGNLELSSFGETFFIAPRPFHMTVYSDGDITTQGTDVVTEQGLLRSFGGELSAEFNPIPEPGTLALAGLALLGMGFASRREKK